MSTHKAEVIFKLCQPHAFYALTLIGTGSLALTLWDREKKQNENWELTIHFSGNTVKEKRNDKNAQTSAENVSTDNKR